MLVFYFFARAIKWKNFDFALFLYNHQKNAGLPMINHRGRTFLMFALDSGELSVVRSLCDLGEDVDQRDTEGMTAFHLACKKSNLEMMTLLYERCEPKNYFGPNPSSFDHSPLHLVLISHCLNGRRCLDVPNMTLWTLIKQKKAVVGYDKQKTLQCVEFILNHVVMDVDCLAYKQITIYKRLQLFTNYQLFTPLTMAILVCNLDAARLFIDRGASVNPFRADVCPPLSAGIIIIIIICFFCCHFRFNLIQI